MKLKPIKAQDRNEDVGYLRLLIYGMPGCGKTWLCASAAKDEATSPVLYIEHYGQSASLGVLNLDDSKFLHLNLTDYSDMSHILTWLNRPEARKDIQSQADEATGVEGWFPKTICIDSLTELQRFEVLRVGGNDLSTGLPDTFERPRIQDWGNLLDQFVTFGKRHYRLPFNIVMTLLQKDDYDEKEKIVRQVPAMHGQAATLFPSTALSVMHLEQVPAGRKTKQWGSEEEAIYCRGSFRGTGLDFARDNTGVFPPVVYNPTIPRLAKLLAKALPKEQDVS